LESGFRRRRTGRPAERFRALTVVDVYTRECLATEVGQSLKGYDVVRLLQQIADERGIPQLPFCDNGSDFSSQVLDLWHATTR
jgi:putative transposase